LSGPERRERHLSRAYRPVILGIKMVLAPSLYVFGNHPVKHAYS
jgi:hypothetical protein